MNGIKSILIITIFLMGTPLLAQEGPYDVAVIEPTHVYVPSGFDDNDNAQVVISGYFPNSCYQYSAPSYRINEETRRIYIRHNSYVRTTGYCLQMMIPYQAVIDIGRLERGQYDIVFVKSEGTFVKLADLGVAKSTTPAQDDHMYLPVREVLIKRFDSGVLAILRGRYTSPCMHMKEILVNLTETNIFEILPMAELRDEQCSNELRDFEFDVKLDIPKGGEYLVHTRSLSGKAVNVLFEL